MYVYLNVFLKVHICLYFLKCDLLLINKNAISLCEATIKGQHAVLTRGMRDDVWIYGYSICNTM